MGISELMASIQNAWYTISADGQPNYRVGQDGSPIPKNIMEQLANHTAQSYGIVTQENPYIAPDPQPLAIA